ncbi:Lysozyme c-1 [Eumeta japonica]|uniref:Lysozyme n=1 Tax=Eumeta variegata TaxID=151549 RepID=A0A4C1TSR2_EUMVA|nr:Lysozyme c-1 [Eumeta japonica]
MDNPWKALVVERIAKRTCLHSLCRMRQMQELFEDIVFVCGLHGGVCLVEQESGKNTSAYNERSLKKFYGLFQIGSDWCKEGKKGGKCGIACESLLDDDIRDDCVCALKVFEQEGFKYWKKWDQRCKGHTLPDIEKCPDYSNPPAPRASPPRKRRNARYVNAVPKKLKKQ